MMTRNATTNNVTPQLHMFSTVLDDDGRRSRRYDINSLLLEIREFNKCARRGDSTDPYRKPHQQPPTELIGYPDDPGRPGAVGGLHPLNPLNRVLG